MRADMNTLEKAIRSLKKGGMIIVADARERENEADLVMAAEKATPRTINFMITHARGLLCAPMTRERAEELTLPPMVAMEENTEVTKCDFTISVDAKRGTTTGISARDRATTLRALAHAHTRPYDLARPGHIFPLRAHPGGVLYRPGHTEAAVDLIKLAGLHPIGVICEMLDEKGNSVGRKQYITAFAKRYQLPLITIEDIIGYRRKHEAIIKKVATAKLPTEYGTFTMHVYRSLVTGVEHVALVRGTINPKTPTYLRVHSQCLTGDTFHSLRCDCRAQLTAAMKKIAGAGTGVIVYLNQEGRGIGLTQKIRSYALQERGADTVTANEQLGLPVDMRDYNVGSQIVTDLGIKKIRLLTNNPRKITGIAQYGLEVVERVPLEVKPQRYNKKYLKTKRDRLGHMLTILERR